MGNHHKPAVTLQTIADELNVSRTTISNAFNKPDQMTPELREKILATAKNLGYCGPDPIAKSLRSGVSGAYGLVLTESLSYMVTDPAAQQILLGIAEVFDESDLGLLTIPAKLDRSSGIKRVRDAAVDGFILNSLASDDPRIPSVVARNQPVVVLHGPMLPGYGFIGAADEGGGRAVAEHIVELGHTRIGILTFPLHEDDLSGPITGERLATATITPARERIQAFQAVLEEHGIAWESVQTWEAGINSVESGTLGAGRMLDRAQRPTAILATSDQLALGAIEAARTRGLRVPQDVSIAGFDDIPAATRCDPPLTTVRQPLRLAGAMSAKMLLEGWEGDPPRVILPTELIVRASTAPASHL
jgi:DNA-binding LacI/PurR family transcriptional regulator